MKFQTNYAKALYTIHYTGEFVQVSIKLKLTGAWGKGSTKRWGKAGKVKERRKGGCETKFIAGNEGMKRDGDTATTQTRPAKP